MKQGVQFTFLSVVTFYLFGCNGLPSTIIDVEVEDDPDKMIVHAYFLNTDTMLRMHLDKSVSLFALDTLESGLLGDLEGASVELSGDSGQSIMLEFIAENEREGILNYGNSFNYPLRMLGKNLTLKIKHPILEEVSSTQVFPEEVPIESIKYLEDAGELLRDGNISDGIQIQFTDPPTESNYYQVLLLSSPSNDRDNLQRLRIRSDDPIFDAENSNEVALVVSDETFGGDTYIFNILLTEELNEGQDIYLIWRSISKEWFEYVKSTKQQDGFNGLLGNFTEPFNIISNIEGGLGVFGLGTEERILIQQ